MIIYLPLVIEKTKMTRQNQYSSVVFFFMHLQMCMMGIEPTLFAPEANALSIKLHTQIKPVFKE